MQTTSTINLKKRKVAIIGTNGLPASYGGFETLVNYLTLYNKDFDVVVYCSKTAKDEQIPVFNNARLIYLPFNANGWQSIIYDIFSIINSWFKHDTLLLLGTPGSPVLPLLRIFKKTKVVVNFGGLEWKREKWHPIARKYLKFSEAVAIKNSEVIVADNQHFCNYIKESYNKESHLVEYGGDHTSSLAISPELRARYPFLENEYYISVSRAQADNNLHIVLEAFSKLPEKKLVLVSNWNNFAYGVELRKEYENYPNINMIDAVYDLAVLDVLRSNAVCYIHSHSFCGTAPSLVEAMSLGLPVISFENETNSFTTEGKALFFKDTQYLLNILSHTSASLLADIGVAMKGIAVKRYTWERISQLYFDQF